jgi:hypothetical protein
MGNLITFGATKAGEIQFGESLTYFSPSREIPCQPLVWDGESSSSLFARGTEDVDETKKLVLSKWACRRDFLRDHRELLSERRHACLSGFDAKDEAMECLMHVPGLVTLWIHANSNITDEVMMGLVHLMSLETLNVSQCCRITGTGVENVGSLSKLRRLFLSRVGVTDDSLDFVSYLELLTDLQLSWTKITSVGTECLSELPLENLDVAGTAVADLSALSRITSLKQLNLSGTKVEDNEMAKLNALVNLELLLVCDTGVTDEGIRQLNIPTLKYVNAKGTAVGVRSIGAARVGVSRECYRH